ncbi:MAG: site-specific integrase [Bacteroidota bacterium]
MGYTLKNVIRRENKRADGNYHICLRITIDRKLRYHPTNKYINEKLWDDNTGLATEDYPNAKQLNHFLDELKLKADKFLLNLEILDTEVNHEKVLNYLGNKKAPNFFDFVKEEDKLLHHQWSKDYIRTVGSHISKLKAFNPNLRLSDINYDFLVKYETHMRSTKGNVDSTVYTNFKSLKVYVKRALKRKLITEYPFVDYTLKTGKSQRQYLEMEELVKMEQLLDFNIPFYLKNALIWFLFACYTGFRKKDIIDIGKWHIYEEYITIVSHKTQEKSEIFKNKRLERIFEYIDTREYRMHSKINVYIKELAEMAGINKSLSLHSGRHTFGHINTDLGNDILINQELLGHSDINSTRIYTGASHETLKNASKKWDRF